MNWLKRLYNRLFPDFPHPGEEFLLQVALEKRAEAEAKLQVEPKTVFISLVSISHNNRLTTAHVMGTWLGQNNIKHTVYPQSDHLKYVFHTDSDAVMFKLFATGAMEQVSDRLYG